MFELVAVSHIIKILTKTLVNFTCMKLSFLFPSKVSLLRDWDGGEGNNATAKLSPFQETVIQQMGPGSSMENCKRKWLPSLLT